MRCGCELCFKGCGGKLFSVVKVAVGVVGPAVADMQRTRDFRTAQNHARTVQRYRIGWHEFAVIPGKIEAARLSFEVKSLRIFKADAQGTGLYDRLFR